jgi:pantetheine-phosphate adenylyltransferase
MPSADYTYLSSTMVKQIAQLKGEITPFVPEYVREKLIEKFH